MTAWARALILRAAPHKDLRCRSFDGASRTRTGDLESLEWVTAATPADSPYGDSPSLAGGMRCLSGPLEASLLETRSVLDANESSAV
jgi:hypothetical protein